MTESSQKFRILVVEDEEINKFYVETFLMSEGFEVVTAENGLLAVERFKSTNFDLVLMDIQMPIMDGYEATTLLRAFEKENSKEPTPIIAVTAYAMTEDINKCLEVGMNDYVLKPIIIDEALDKINRYIPHNLIKG